MLTKEETPVEENPKKEEMRKAGEPKGRSSLVNDFVASLVVFLIALPLCMGIAIASGAPPALGIITGIVGGLVVGLIGGSPLQVSGPAAGLSVVVFELIQKLGLPMLGPVLLLAGILQLIGGWCKLGRWFRAISPAVIYGMLSGIGVLIIASQFHVMVDDKPRASGIANIIAMPESLWKGIFPPDETVHHLAAIIGVATLAAILLWNRFRPKSLKIVPGSLVGVTLGTLLAIFFKLPIRYVDLPENLFASLSFPGAASFGNLLNPEALFVAITIAVVASAETMLSASAVDKMHTGPRTNFDKELRAQGVGNFLCGCFGALPMTGVIVRSSANVQAGAKTRLSAILHAIWLLSLVAFFPGVLRAIPTSSLAAILVFTGVKLIEMEHIKKLLIYGKFPIVIYGATVGGIVLKDLLTGVLIGLGLTIVKVLYKATKLDVDVKRSEGERRVDIRLSGVASFMRLPKLQEALENLPPDRIVHLNVDNLHYIDHTTFEMLQATAKQMEGQGGELVAPWDVLSHRFHLESFEHEAAPATH